MIINTRASESIDVGRYLTDRDEKAFTVIEGDAKRFDNICELTLENRPQKKNSHYSFVLSFKEEHLTKDDLMNYYMQFKDEMFKNYNLNELEMLSVIHWDDVKPHIHCVVVNSSQIDNNRDLRLYRGNVDFSRIEAIQEKINYKNGLVSPFDNYNLLSLTASQKKRDWLVKKRDKEYYEVFDDKVYKDLENILKSDAKISFKKFIKKVERLYGEIDLLGADKFDDKEYNEDVAIKKSGLLLKDKKNSNGDNYYYRSKLFNEKWFNDNIKNIQKSLENREIKSIKYSDNKKPLWKQEKILKETTDKHLEHLNFKKVGKEYIDDNIDLVMENGLKDLLSVKVSRITKAHFESKIERYLDIVDDKYLKKFINYFDYDSLDVMDDGFIRFSIKNKKIDIYNSDVYEYLNGVSAHIDAKEIDSLDFDYNELYSALNDLKRNKNKAKARVLIEDVFYHEKLKDKNEIDALFKRLGLDVQRVGVDSKKGAYLTLSNSSGNFRLYCDAIYNLYKVEVKGLNGEVDYKIKRDKIIENDNLKDVYLSSYIKSVYLGLSNGSDKFINSVNEYRLENINAIDRGKFELKNNSVLKIGYKDNCFNDYEKINFNNKTGGIKVSKSLKPAKSGADIADLYSINGITDLEINNEMDEEIKQGFINRVKEKNYDLSLWDKDSGKLLFQNVNKENIELGRDEKVDLTSKIVRKSINEYGGVSKLLDDINELRGLDIKSKDGVERFRELMGNFNEHSKDSLKIICDLNGINIVRSGNDKKKGIYTTVEFKGKKIAIYGLDVKHERDFILEEV